MHLAVLDKMVATLQSMGIKVQQYHAESGPGQFELATAPCECGLQVARQIAYMMGKNAI